MINRVERHTVKQNKSVYLLAQTTSLMMCIREKEREREMCSCRRAVSRTKTRLKTGKTLYISPSLSLCV